MQVKWAPPAGQLQNQTKPSPTKPNHLSELCRILRFSYTHRPRDYLFLPATASTTPALHNIQSLHPASLYQLPDISSYQRYINQDPDSDSMRTASQAPDFLRSTFHNPTPPLCLSVRVKESRTAATIQLCRNINRNTEGSSRVCTCPLLLCSNIKTSCGHEPWWWDSRGLQLRLGVYVRRYTPCTLVLMPSEGID